MKSMSRAALVAGAIGLATLAGCGAGEDPAGPPLQAAAGKGGGITVTSADPAYGHQGDTQKQVRILGSGFEPGDQASWQRNGAADPDVQVVTTTFVSSTELVATINIDVTAELTFYDIAILRPGRKGGIGTMLFEVTQAVEVPGSITVLAVNQMGQMVGATTGGDDHPFVWSEGSGLVLLAGFGRGQGLSEDGLTIAGGSGAVDIGPRRATVWTFAGGAWQASYLPADANAYAGRARALDSDLLTGAAAVIGGVEEYEGSRPNRGGWLEPRLWVLAGGAWQRIVLPGETAAPRGYVNDVTITGVAVGTTGANGKALIWERTGAGAWVTALVGPAFSEAYEVNTAGTVVVGKVDDKAIYWKKEAGAWTGPFQLGACRRAVAIDDQNRIIADVCPRTSKTTGPAVFAPPYSTSTMMFLGGLGSAAEAYVNGVSRDGQWVVGEAPTKTQGVVGAYWKLF